MKKSDLIKLIKEEIHNVLKEAPKKGIDVVRPMAKKFIKDLEKDLKAKAVDSQIMKTKGGWEVRAVVKSGTPDIFPWAKEYTKKNAHGMPITFAIDNEIPGRKSLWPSDNKMYFDIEESAITEANVMKNNADIEKAVAAAFKKMGLKVVRVDANAFNTMKTPSVEVHFKDLSYGGGDEYDIMNDYNDEYRKDGDVVFMDVSANTANPNLMIFYIDEKESRL